MGASTVFPSGWHPLEQTLNSQVISIAQQAGCAVYLVGGYIRDALLNRYSQGKRPLDYDWAVAGGSAVELARLVSSKLQGHFVLLDQECDTARVVFDDGVMIDFAGCVGGDIQSDLARRDFTINALAWDPRQPDQLLDLFDGLADLQKVSIRAIREQNFVDDPLRLLRAYRFAAALSGSIESSTQEMIARHSAAISTVAAERVSYELFLTLESAQTSDLIAQMGQAGLLEAIFPELSETRKVTPNAFHHLDLWQHSLELVKQAEIHLPELPEPARDSCSNELSQGVSRLAATKLACLLHDIGKPGTWAITPEGRHTFYTHDSLGAEMTEVIAERLRWSKSISRFIVKLVRWHLRPGSLFHQGPPTKKAVNRFYRQMGNEVPELVLLALADLGSTCGAGLEESKRERLESELFELLDGYFVFKSSELAMVRLLDGNQIMKLLNVPPSPAIGELLTALEEAQSLGEVTSVDEAERFVEQTHRNKQSG